MGRQSREKGVSKRGRPYDADQAPIAGERWLPVIGWEGAYEVSDHGRIRRPLDIPGGRGVCPGRILSLRGRIDSKGYPQTQLYRRQRATTIKVHRMVAEAFLGPRPEGCQVNHIDGDKTNNCATNLEWVTPRGNAQHALRSGLFYRGPSPLAGRGKKLKASDVRDIRDRVARGAPRAEIAQEYSVHVMTVGEIVRREIWQSVE